jgi:CheY-like chemotaxis protein
LASMAMSDDESLISAGSPGYVAPEVIEGTQLPADLWPRTDIYALGVIAYELLTSQAAFWGEDAASVLNAQLTSDPRPIHEARPDVDPALDSVIRLALARDPTQRIGSVDTFRRSLIEARRRAADPRAGVRIVIAEDDLASRRLLEKILQREFPTASLASVDNGRDAVSSVSGLRTNLLITDLEMEGLAGEAVIHAIRKETRLRGVAIIVVTGEAGAAEWKRLRAAGADAILLKPIDAVPLVALVKALLEKPMRNRAQS